MAATETTEKKTTKKTATKTAAKKTAAKKTTKKTSAKAGKKYNLVIVESPVKAKTIEDFLGSGYKVKACNGHLIDLPKSKLGVDVENNFEPNYIVIRGKSPLLKELKKEAQNAEKVYLATDPDREGEAISWHIAGALGIDEEQPCRIEFNEITRGAVVGALEAPRPIDKNRVNAQQARRVLDRLVGYKLSPLLWRKVRRGLSAGRVQSVAVRMVVDRENAIRSFVPREYWTITALLAQQGSEHTFEAKLVSKNGEKLEPATEAEANAVLEDLKTSDFIVSEVKHSSRVRRPVPPFTTSTLQQDASRKLGFTTKKTMVVAQTLYEGVKLPGGDTAGLITYMRTDSTRISKDAQDAARAYAAETYGEKYTPEKPNVYTSKKNSQDAHEAIRPTDITRTPASVKDSLSPEQYKLYNLIYTRFLSSQMSNATYDVHTCEMNAGAYMFRATITRMSFDGFTAVYGLSDEEAEQKYLPELTKGEKLDTKDIIPKQNFTSPPTRYTEASLVKALEEEGVGRPSTFSPTISTILDRRYVVKEGKSIVPTELGEIVTSMMIDNFSEIVSVSFTREMEDKLDGVESEGKDWRELLSDFYWPFEKELEAAEEKIEPLVIPDRPAGIICEKCGAEMVYKMGRFGEFIACPNYPECKNAKPIKVTIDAPCPKCGGTLVQKKSKKNRTFFGCDNYPDCNFMSWDKPLLEKCPECGAYMLEKQGRGPHKKYCSNENCVTNQKTEKTTRKKAKEGDA